MITNTRDSFQDNVASVQTSVSGSFKKNKKKSPNVPTHEIPQQVFQKSRFNLPPKDLTPYINILTEGERDLTFTEARIAFTACINGASDCQMSAFLAVLRARRETPTTLHGFAQALDDYRRPIPLIHAHHTLLDIHGTGGTGRETINFSSGAAVLAAACGCTVAKGGQRSTVTRSGSADVLEAGGVDISLKVEAIARCIEFCGMGFVELSACVPAMRYVLALRRTMKTKTAFSLMGPLANFADATRLVIGVYEERLVKVMADTLELIGKCDHAAVVYGCGLDELSPLGPATIREVKNTAPRGKTRTYTQKEYTFDPLSINIPRCKIVDLKSSERGTDAYSCSIGLRTCLRKGDEDNKIDPRRDTIVLNAGLGLYVYGMSESIEEGCKRAREVLDAGGAEEKFRHFMETTQRLKKLGGRIVGMPPNSLKIKASLTNTFDGGTKLLDATVGDF